MLAIAGLIPGAAQAGTLVVSLTFDDTVDDIRNQDGSSVDSVFWQAQNTLRPLGMRATLYVNAPRLLDGSGATRSFLTTQQLRDLAAPGGGLTGRGHDIGGHSLHHLTLPNVEARSAAAEEVEQQRQICVDRQSLTTITTVGSATLSVWDFAYPFGAYEWNGSRSLNYYFGPPVPPVDGYETRDRVGRQSGRCGYLTGRRAGGLDVGDTGDTCSGCPPYETIPPSSRWAIKTAPSVDADDTLAEIESWIVNAKAAVDLAGVASGWLPLVFHNLCTPSYPGDCADDQRFPGADFAALANWLATQTGVEVKSVHDVVDPATTTEKAITVPAAAAANSTVFNGESAIDSNRDELPDCFQLSGTTARAGRADRATGGGADPSGWYTWLRFDPKGGTLSGTEQARFMTRGDEGECSLSVRPGTNYEARFWFRASDPARVCPYSTGCAAPPAAAAARGTRSVPADAVDADGHGYRGEPIPPASEDEAPGGLAMGVGVPAALSVGTPFAEPRWSEHLASTRVWTYSPRIFSGAPKMDVDGTVPTTWTAAATGFGGPLHFMPSAGVDRVSFGVFLSANGAAQPVAPAKIGLDVDHFSFCRVAGSGTADDPVAVCAPDTPPAQ